MDCTDVKGPTDPAVNTIRAEALDRFGKPGSQFEVRLWCDYYYADGTAEKKDCDGLMPLWSKPPRTDGITDFGTGPILFPGPNAGLETAK